MKKLILTFAIIFAISTPAIIANAESEILLRTAVEHVGGYDRALFRHWIDADMNGCDTRKEVLIAEAIVKPKKSAKCILTGGKWISSYDGKSYLKDSGLDIDHVVPLAEAWRSGAWAWNSKQRQDFANDITDSRALIAVSASANRSKGDQDVKTWLPAKNKCAYIEAWVAVKVRYSLTFDTGELSVIQSYFTSCPITNISVDVLPGYETVGNKIVPTPTPSTSTTSTQTPSTSTSSTPTSRTSATPSASPSTSATSSASPSTSATPSASQTATISPGAFCSPAGAIGKSAAGGTYTCKTSPTDTRNRWRQ